MKLQANFKVELLDPEKGSVLGNLEINRGDIDTKQNLLELFLFDPKAYYFRTDWDYQILYSDTCFVDKPFGIIDVSDVKYDLQKSRELKSNELRFLRKPLFEELDSEFIKYLSLGDEVSLEKIKKKQKYLRDLPTELNRFRASRNIKNFEIDLSKIKD